MKKLICLCLIIIFINTNTSFISTATGEQSYKTAKISIDKKDPKLINLPDNSVYNNAAVSKKLEKDITKVKGYKKNLNESYYSIYKICDKLLRANNLTNQNWRLALEKDVKDINAYATAANLLVIKTSLYDSFYNDEDALAFVIAHEISHFLYNHHQRTVDLNKKRENIAAWGGVYVPLTLCLGYLYLIPRYYSTYKDDRKMEFEADSEAIVLMTRAGFNPKGAYTSLEFIGKLPTKYTASSTHPKTEKRIENVANTISKINTYTLKNQGLQNLYNSEVLEPLISSDDKSIIISSGANKKNYEYIKNSSNSNYIFEAYRNYIKNDYNKAADLFEKAYESNKKDYIAPLYLSLIYEEEYNRTKNTDFLKKANNYAKKAKKNAPANINVIKQYNDIKAELKSGK